MGHQAIKVFLYLAGVEQGVHSTQMAGQRKRSFYRTGVSALAT